MSVVTGGMHMAELVRPPELERQIDPLDPSGAPLAPVEIRFKVKPDPGEKWSEELAAECSVNDQPAPSPGAVLSFQQWESDSTPTLYCYALSRNLREGDTVTLRVHPRDKRNRPESDVLFEKQFTVRVQGEEFHLE
jgi:hypothetical protein